MSVIRCAQGLHFYDDEKFATCPHCEAGMNIDKWTDMSADDLNSQDTMSMPDMDADINETVGVIQEQLVFQGFNGFPDTGVHISDVDDDVTIAFHSPEKGNDYITGWLVCIEGPEKGRDYRIYHGVNKMGRGDNMDIIVRDDKSISREKVVSVIYDIKSNKFYLSPAVNGVVYLNDGIINKAMEIVTGDKFTIGDSTFEFIAYCRDDKKWE